MLDRAALAVLSNAARVEARISGFQHCKIDCSEASLTFYDGGRRGGETILLVHGFTADKDVWVRFARALKKDYRVLMVDLAGHGESPFDPAWDYSYQAQAERLASFLNALRIQSPVHIAGNSMGGGTAAVFAGMYPDRTRSVTLIDPQGLAGEQPSELDAQLSRGGPNPFLVNNQSEFRRMYAMAMEKPPFMPGFLLRGAGFNYIQRRRRHEQIFGDFHHYRITPDDVKAYSGPALQIWGRLDRLIHVSASESWKDLLPQIQTRYMDGLGHMPMMEAPGDCAAIYRQFLNELTSTGYAA